MSRVSDTRLRTREAAARLVAAGRRPHDLTVDLIYADIKQGSRTTINDELKLWKDEQAKADALTEALPPVVASVMLNFWAVAVEHGEKVFDQQRETLEMQLGQAVARADGLEAEKIHLAQQLEGAQAEVAQGRSDLNTARESLAGERAAKDAALVRAGGLEQQLDVAKTDSERTIAALKSEHRQQVEALQAALAAQEASFRLEIGKATERLEGVQRHVMLQVAEARDAQKRSEAQLSKSNQKNEQLQVEVQHLGRQIAAMAQTAERAQADLNKAHDDLAQLRAERESLVQQVAAAGGKLSAFGDQIEALEHRAVGAETRLEEALQRPAVQKKRTTQPSQKRKTSDKSSN